MADKKQITTGLVILIATVLLVTGTMYVTNLNQKNSNTTKTTSQASDKVSTSTSSNSGFKDGAYEATGSYVSPGGNEEIKIRITLKNGVITSTSAQSKAHSSDGAEFQSQFIGAYKSEVVGKKITNVHLSQVSGSSLTSQGFNDALSQIENQAKA